jgi:hypothetical protein
MANTNLGTDSTVVYVKQDDDSWVEQVVASSDPGAARSCGEAFEGATCSLDYYSYQPLSVATSESGDVRLLYARHHHLAEMEAECMMGGPGGGFCDWTGPSTTLGSVHLAWETGGALSSVQIASGFAAYGADMEIDEAGDMHLAVYATTDVALGETATSLEVRYLRFGHDD